MVFGFGEGKIEIKLEKYNFVPGEMIRGKVLLTVNKPKQARGLRIVFSGIEKTSRASFSSRGARNQNYTKPIHRFELPLDGEHEYSGVQEYDFEIAVPKIPVAAPDGALGTVLTAARFMGGQVSRYEWWLDASLNCEGFDINKKVQINVVQ